MTQFIVRNVPDEVAEALRRRASQRGRSVEAEHREVLREALLPVVDFKAFLRSMPDVGVDADFVRA